MKKNLLITLALLFSFAAGAQKIIKHNPYANKAVEHTAKAIGNETTQNQEVAKPYELPTSKDFAPVIIGSTIYDLQTNSSVTRRISRQDDGTMSAVWTRGMESPSYPDRGTGFNYFDGSSWGPSPETRIEESIRTGWPAIIGIDRDIAFAHDFGAGEIVISANSAFGLDDWTTSVAISGSSMPSVNWPKAVRGGTDGNTIHLVGGTNAQEWEGITGNIGYFRSTDGGATWDITEYPLLNSNELAHVSGETWAIDAVGNNVAILMTTPWGDVAVYKSTDNGDSWVKYTILDFPDAAEPFDYTTDVLDIDNDGNADTIVTADQSGSVVIDNNGKVHCAFGLMRYTPADNTWYYFPYSDGLTYWNEDMPEGVFSMDHVTDSKAYLNMQLGEVFDTLVMSPDLNGDDTIHQFAWENAASGEPAFGKYGVSVTSFPNLIVGENNSIFLVYSTVMEGDDYAKQTANPGSQNFRHLWAMTVGSNGGSEPVLLTVGDDFKQYEHVFPMCYRYAEANPSDMTSNLKFTYQMDDEPGHSISGDEDAATTNYIMYVDLDVIDVGINDLDKSTRSKIFSFTPNPARNTIQVESATNSEITICNLLGAEALKIEKASELQTIDISGLAKGTYIINLKSTEGFDSQKLIIQ